MNDLQELIRTYCKAVGGDTDHDVMTACEELLATFREAVKTDDPEAHFAAALKEAVSYAGWNPGNVRERREDY